MTTYLHSDFDHTKKFCMYCDEGPAVTDPTRAAAVAALAEARGAGGQQLDAILANPDHIRALLAVLLPEQRAFLADALWDEAVETPSGRTPKSGTLPGAYLELADRLIRRLTEPTDTGSGT